ncbi:MAG: hypothetical protein IKN94_08045 [Salinivirgaceae bacterium]|nr:hypothetical protein [Salinivirgaceae bacterium]
MSFPGVQINVTNGNLQQEIAVLDAVPALVATVKTTALVGEVKQVYSLADAESKGYTESAEPFMHRLLDEYYTELGGRQRLFVMGIAAATSMAQALTATNANGVQKLLNAAQGEINLVAIAREPASGYNPGTAFLDSDVSAAVTASKTLCEAWQSQNHPFRVFIEGRVADETKTNAYSPNTATNGFASVVLGGTDDDGSAAVSLALARASKYGAHIKLGSGENGALTAQQIYIGEDKLEERLDMETLHDAGFLTFMHRPGAAGYYFGRDNMCSTDDYRILAHGRIIDKVQRIAAQAYLPFVETPIRMNADGTVNATDAAYIEATLENAVRAAMSEQISGIKVSVPLTQDVINTSTLSVDVKVQPLGYLTWITVTLGLATSL